MGRLRYEVSTLGVDEGLQGLSSDPFAANGFSASTGLRVPPVLTGVTQANMPRYLFCLATRKFNRPTKIVGLRQGFTIGLDANAGTPPERPLECFVRTPTFRFVDGNISWHLVKEPADLVTSHPSTDTEGWSFLQSDSSAMLYQSFTNTVVNPQTGAPIYYFQNMMAYAPPKITSGWQAIAGLGNMHELRFPWDSHNAWDHLNIEVLGAGRISLYASILQTNPATRTAGANEVTTLSVFATPEECFVEDLNIVGVETPTIGPQYWRVFGSIIFEDEVND